MNFRAILPRTPILHSRLSAALGKARHADGLVRIHSDRKDVAALLDQVEHRLTRRTALVTSRALTLDHPWKQGLIQQLQAANSPSTTRRVLQDVALFRDRWGVTDETLPLGPQPNWEDVEMSNHRHRIEATIADADRATAHYGGDLTGPAAPLRTTTSGQHLGMGM